MECGWGVWGLASFSPPQALPLENKMKSPNHFITINWLAMFLIITLYTSFGIIGYLAYGSRIEDSITLNLEAVERLGARA